MERSRSIALRQQSRFKAIANVLGHENMSMSCVKEKVS